MRNIAGYITGKGVMRLFGQTILLRTSDPSEFELALRPWELLCRPTAAGQFRHRLVLLQTNLFMMYREAYSLPLHLQGLTPANMLGFGLPLNIGRQASFWGVKHEGRSMPGTMPGPLDARTKAGHEQIIVFIDIDCLKSTLSPAAAATLIHHAGSHRVVLRPVAFRQLAAWVSVVLQHVETAPDLAEDPQWLEAVLHALTGHLEMVAMSLQPPEKLEAPGRREQGLKEAIAYLCENTARNVSIRTLSGVAGISERSLQYAFSEAFGFGPLKFMALRRLHRARQDLVAARAGEVTVTDIALRNGFSELGRFSGRYRHRFGELPSRTLVRNGHPDA